MKCSTCGAPIHLDMDAEPMYAPNNELAQALQAMITASKGAKLPRNLAIHLTEAKDQARAALKRAKGEA